MEHVNEQHVPGRTSPCCASMRMALACGYIQKGFLWYKFDPPLWVFWRMSIKGEGFYEVSPIHFCPFCGVDLDSGE